jgi:hypothetical protein
MAIAFFLSSSVVTFLKKWVTAHRLARLVCVLARLIGVLL